MDNKDLAKIVDDVIRSRKSIRAFLDKSVDHQLILDILNVASRAPSGSNVQPWKVYVLEGDAKARLSHAIKAIFNDPAQSSLHRPEYIYYPKTWTEPYLSRRRKVGFDLYKLVGIARGESQKMHEQHAKNFDFFGAPIALILTIPRMMELGSWLDYGMFIQNILLAAQARGLQSCPQAALIQFHQIVSQHVGYSAQEQMVCSISMGYEDPFAPENQIETERVSATEFATFLSK
jgi:nitroreductase